MSKNFSAIKQERNSNLELFRIIAMLLIVAHHYVVNSGLLAIDGPVFSNPLAFKSIFLLLFGMWGKIGINCFVLITGYFMCTSNITLKKFLKLILEIYFYKILLYIVFLIAGYQQFSIKSLINVIIPISGVTDGFVPCYILFFLFIPFLNILVKHLSHKMHLYLVLLCLFIYTFLGTIPSIDVTFNYVTWFIVLYFMAAYIRLYPNKIFDSVKASGWITLGFVVLSMLSVVVIQFAAVKFEIGVGEYYYFVADSNKILALLTAVAAFLFFKNIKIKTSKFINTVAASTFGVLLIHAGSDAMRQWLWHDMLNNVGMYNSNLIYVHAIVAVLGIFIICTIIDFGRRKLVEEPFFRWFDKKEH